MRAEDVASIRDHLARELSRGSANMAVKILRICLGAAIRRGLLTSNPATAVDTLKKREESKRRPFGVTEVKRVLTACHDEE